MTNSQERIGDAWSSIRGIVRNCFSFAQIKDLVGAAGLPVHQIGALQQKFSGGASKGQLMDAIDRLVTDLETARRDRFVVACVEEMLQRSPDIRDQLDITLSRVGWGVSPDGAYPLQLQIDVETTSISGEVRAGVAKCMSRYRDGDFDGAVTAICGVVDRMTEDIYEKYGLGNHKADSYQQRVSRGFSALKEAYKAPLAGKLPADDARRMWENHRSSVNQAAYVLGAFRRDFSDAHGSKDTPRELVQRAIDCAVFIVRSIAGTAASIWTGSSE